MKRITILLAILAITFYFILERLEIDNPLNYLDKYLLENTEEVTFDSCIDGDTAWFILAGERTKVRFLYIDTPESTNTIEEYGKEASNFTCEYLNAADEIRIEYDGDKHDKYGRILAWVFVDDTLLQSLIASNGYVKQYYDFGDYKYEEEVKDALNDIYGIFKGVKE